MRDRFDVVAQPRFVAWRKEIQAAYARARDAEKRIWGASGPGVGHFPPSHLYGEYEEHSLEHARLSREYEAAVLAAMDEDA